MSDWDIETKYRNRTNRAKELLNEGLAREFVNRIQILRKDNSLEVTDKINIAILKNEKITSAIKNNLTYICNETLAKELRFVKVTNNCFTKIELIDSIFVKVNIEKALSNG